MMHCRILIVLFMLSLTLLLGENAGATTITHNFLFTIDRILINGEEYTKQDSDEDFEDEFEWLEDDFEWAKGETFNLSFSYEEETARSTTFYQILTYHPTLSLGLNRDEFGLESISGGRRTNYFKPWPDYSSVILEAVVINEYSSAGSNYFTLESTLGSNVWNGHYQFTEPTCSGFNNNIIVEFSTPVPEPSTLILLGAGLVGLLVYRKNRQR